MSQGGCQGEHPSGSEQGVHGRASGSDRTMFYQTSLLRSHPLDPKGDARVGNGSLYPGPPRYASSELPYFYGGNEFLVPRAEAKRVRVGRCGQSLVHGVDLERHLRDAKPFRGARASGEEGRRFSPLFGVPGRSGV